MRTGARAPVEDDPSKSRTKLNDDDSKKPYIYAEAACPGGKSKFCNLEACMKKEMETTNM